MTIEFRMGRVMPNLGPMQGETALQMGSGLAATMSWHVLLRNKMGHVGRPRGCSLSRITEASGAHEA